MDEFKTFLEGRGLGRSYERIIENKIDQHVILIMTDEQLKEYFPFYGDRLAVTNFCSRLLAKDEKDSKRENLLGRLRAKLKLKRSGEECEDDKTHGVFTAKRKLHSTHSYGNSNAKRTSRQVEIGWMHRDESGRRKQVRKNKGGGTRKTTIEKKCAKTDIITIAKALFFPDGMSPMGKSDEFEFDVIDFKENSLSETDTVGTLYEKTKLTLLRLYIATHRKKASPESESGQQCLLETEKVKSRVIHSVSNLQADNSDPEIQFGPFSDVDETFSATLPITHSPMHSSTPIEGNQLPSMPGIDGLPYWSISPVAALGSAPKLSLLPGTDKYPDLSTILTAALGSDPKPSLLSGTDELPDSSTIPAAALGSAPKPSLLSGTDELPDLSTIPAAAVDSMPGADELPRMSTRPAAAVDSMPGADELPRMSTRPAAVVDSSPRSNSMPGTEDFPNVLFRDEMVVRRGFALNDMLDAFIKEPSLGEGSLIVKRVLANGNTERGDDTGGVLRDTLSEFWEDFYDTCTVGATTKVPFLRHDYDQQKWCAVGKILRVGYHKVGYFPVKLAPSFMKRAMATSDSFISSQDDILMDYLNFVPTSEKETLQKAMDNFEAVDSDELLEIFDEHKARRIPTASNLRQTVMEFADKDLIQEPMFVINCWQKEIQGLLTPQAVDELYNQLTPTSKRVIKILRFPTELTSLQQDSKKHLTKFIREMDSANLGKFLRYCTGADILCMDKIEVTFSKLTGFERRPIAHTCAGILEIPEDYANFPEFRSEFQSLLASNIWVMDFV